MQIAKHHQRTTNKLSLQNFNNTNIHYLSIPV